jgi:hypothetical protein
MRRYSLSWSDINRRRPQFGLGDFLAIALLTFGFIGGICL